MRRGALIAVLVLAGCGGGSSMADQVADTVKERGFDSDVSSVSCQDAGEAMGISGFRIWRCGLDLDGGGTADCIAVSGQDRIHLEQCKGVRVDPPSIEEVEETMLLGTGGAKAVDCREEAERRWSCSFVMNDPSQTASGVYTASPDGSAEISGSMSGSSSAEDP